MCLSASHLKKKKKNWTYKRRRPEANWGHYSTQTCIFIWKVMTPRSPAVVKGDRWSRWPGTWESSHLSGMEVFLSVTSVVVIFRYHLCKWKKRDDQGSSPYFPDAYNSWGSAKVNGRSPALNPSLPHGWQEPNYLSHHSLPLRCPLAGNWNWNWSPNSIPGT